MSNDGTQMVAWFPPVLQGERVMLRPLTLEDAEHIYDYARNPNMCRAVSWEPHASVDYTRAFLIDYVFPNYQRGVPEPWGIVLRKNPEVIIGTVGCSWGSKSPKTMELGYAIAEPHWGQGLVAEASRLVLDYCFREFDLIRIQARCMTFNRASARVMEKIGMSFEGTLRSVMLRRGELIDLHQYSILRSEWLHPERTF